METVKVREDNILVREIAPEKVSAAGLHLVRDKFDGAKTMRADVLSVGPDVRYVQVGDVVIADVLAGSQWGEHIFMREGEVLAVERED